MIRLAIIGFATVFAAGVVSSAERIAADSVHDVLTATADGQTLFGEQGHDMLDGAGFNDLQLFGGKGRDIIDGGGGENVQAFGGDGLDYIFGPGLFGIFDGGRGDDRIIVSDFVNGEGGQGNDIIFCRSDSMAVGGEGKDILLAQLTGIDCLLSGGPDSDLVVPVLAEGSNSALGGDGADTIFSGETATSDGGGADVIFTREFAAAHGDDGDDILIDVATPILIAASMFGDEGDDVLLGYQEAADLSGGPGNDHILSGPIANTMTGGDDADTFYVGPGMAADEITDFDVEVDTLNVSGFNFASVASVLALAAQVNGDTVINFGAGDVLTLTNVDLIDLSEDNIVVQGGIRPLLDAFDDVERARSASSRLLARKSGDIEMLLTLAGLCCPAVGLPLSEAQLEAIILDMLALVDPLAVP